MIILDGKAPGKLSTFGNFVRHITSADLSTAQFSGAVPFGLGGKTVKRPMEWH